MTDQERADKLKARMSRWQAYVDRPQTQTLPQPGETREKKTESPARQAAPVIERPLPPLLPIPTEHVAGRGRAQSDTAFSDPTHAEQEARIADLQTAIVREREQTDRLAEEVRRAQTLHAATLYTQMQEERTLREEHIPAHCLMPDPPPRNYEEERRKNLGRVIGLLLAITSVLVVAFFATR